MGATNLRVRNPRAQSNSNETQYGYRTGVSLHSHTLHSRESLEFIVHASRHSALLRHVLKRGQERYRFHHGTDLDLRRGWWTPPLAPLDAYELEAGQLKSMGLTALVSLSDHDDIEAPMSLQAITAGQRIPVSVEWTVPYRRTFFHLGIHNLAPLRARFLMRQMAAFTADPKPAILTDLLAELDADPATLIVFNHPLWDESGVGTDEHNAALLELLETRGSCFHALELNGLRPWSENKRVLELAETRQIPLVSGGDRHAIEPNAIVNLSNAADFAEFVSEVRRDAESNVLILPHYHEAHASRIFHNMLDVFRTYENHGRGWKDWADRVFYTGDDGQVRSLAQIWGDRPPRVVAAFAGFMQLASNPPLRRALRSMAPSQLPAD